MKKIISLTCAALVMMSAASVFSQVLRESHITSLVLTNESTTSSFIVIGSPVVGTPYSLELPLNDGDANQVLTTDGSGILSWSDVGLGDFVGPASAFDNALVRFDALTGKLGQNSALILEDYSTATQNKVVLRPDDGATANISLVLALKGSGALMADDPDGAVAGGNARGSNAVDFQIFRNNATEVASGGGAFIGGGGANTASGVNSVVAGGGGNDATNTYSFVGGGENNTSSGLWSAVVGGNTNSATTAEAFVGAGTSNQATGGRSGVVSGIGNVASGGQSGIVGGGGNDATDDYSFVGGGQNNQAGDAAGTTADRSHATVGGGFGNTASGQYSTVGGGQNNTTGVNINATIGGGSGNTITSFHGTIAGGTGNAAAFQSFVGGGNSNDASGSLATIGGGDNNVAQQWATVGGGQNNSASANGATVGGGTTNTAGATRATIAGGADNTASGSYSSIGGGQQAVAANYGQAAHASGMFTNAGDAQTSVFVARKSGTGAQVLALDGAADEITMATDAIWAFKMLIVGTESNAVAQAAFEVTGLAENSTGTVNVIVANVNAISNVPAWGGPVVTGNGSDLRITCTGGANAVQWVARVETSETVFP